MAELPSYEESTGNVAYFEDEKYNSKHLQRWSLQAEVGATREQHATAVAWKLAPQIRRRAHQGLSNSVFLLLPRTNGASWPSGELADFYNDQVPIQIQLDSALDTVEFWSQTEPLNLLKSRLISVLSGDKVTVRDDQHLPIQKEEVAKRSWLGRKLSKSSTSHALGAAPLPKQELPIEVDVRLSDAHFRTESAAGLMETMRAQGVVVAVHVR